MHLEHLLKGKRRRQMQMTIQKEGLKNGKMKGRGLWLHGLLNSILVEKS